MTTNSGSAIGTAGIGTAVEREWSERDTPEEVWALAITQALVDYVPRHSLGSLDAAECQSPDERGPPNEPVRSAGDAARGDGELAATASDEARTKTPGLPDQLTTELSDDRLGKLELVVSRGVNGLRIVINVADSHVKALIMAEQQSLIQSLKDTGLGVVSVQIRHGIPSGTALAPDREGVDRTRDLASLRRNNSRWRVYQGPLEEDADAETERVDFTA